jgi:hypothetical protein
VLREIEPTLSTTSEGKAVLAGSLPAVGRRGILDVALRGNPKESFQQQAGYPETREETPADIAVKLYRDLQIRKLLSTLA